MTGFDLPKLMAGSWGTLAVLLSITLRVLPRPRDRDDDAVQGLSDQAANRLMSAAWLCRQPYRGGPRATAPIAR